MITVISTLGIALCAIIALIGMLNFVNAIVTEIISRKREFAMLHSSRKKFLTVQLRQQNIISGKEFLYIQRAFQHF